MTTIQNKSDGVQDSRSTHNGHAETRCLIRKINNVLANRSEQDTRCNLILFDKLLLKRLQTIIGEKKLIPTHQFEISTKTCDRWSGPPSSCSHRWSTRREEILPGSIYRCHLSFWPCVVWKTAQQAEQNAAQELLSTNQILLDWSIRPREAGRRLFATETHPRERSTRECPGTHTTPSVHGRYSKNKTRNDGHLYWQHGHPSYKP